ncbi:hypothetical protein L596_010743 [Steinernema carpocapsae]|uniref:Tectonic domain-containing protein n=1 Tax=Steinernema carpocapsae TaxID=34508 RepID=A0A4U5PJD6_STECR|nr:hypothetical protein L596_010743 [Steinernema carpocapsae]
MNLHYSVLLATVVFSMKATLSPQLPFFLFGSDKPPKLLFNESVCVFISCTDTEKLSRFSFTPVISDGSFGQAVNASSFVPTTNGVSVGLGKHCFDLNVTAVLVDNGHLFDNVDASSPLWRSVVVLFVSKKQTIDCQQGDLNSGNVYRVPDSFTHSVVQANADCPGLVLQATNRNTFFSTEQSKYCSLMLFEQPWYSRNWTAGEKVTVEAVQHGMRPLSDPSMFSFTEETVGPRDGQMFLRNAVIIRTTRSDWQTVVNVDRLLLPSDKNGTCPLGRMLESTQEQYTGIIDSDPYGLVDVDFQEKLADDTFPGIDTSWLNQSSITLNVVLFDINCSELNISTTFRNRTIRSRRNGLQPHRFEFVIQACRHLSSNVPTLQFNQSNCVTTGFKLTYTISKDSKTTTAFSSKPPTTSFPPQARFPLRFYGGFENDYDSLI